MTTKKPSSNVACVLQPYEWMLIAAFLAKRWPIQTFSSHTMAFVSREVWMDAQRQVLAADRVLTRFNLSDIREQLVDVVREMKAASQKAPEPFVRTFNVPEPFVTRSEARDIAKKWLTPFEVKPRLPRVLVIGVIAAQERRLRETFSQVEFKFVHADHLAVLSKVKLHSFVAVLGMVDKMSHKVEDVVGNCPQYHRVPGSFSNMAVKLSAILSKEKS